MTRMTTAIRRLATEEEGIQNVEEALMMGLMAIVAIIAMTGIGAAIGGIFDKACTEMAGAATNSGATVSGPGCGGTGGTGGN